MATAVMRAPCFHFPCIEEARATCRSFKHKVHELFQYILAHLLRMQLPPAYASRLLDLHIESSFSMSKAPAALSSSDGATLYRLLMDRLRLHAIMCFNRAEFSEDVRVQCLFLFLLRCRAAGRARTACERTGIGA